mmetsp:Transcript_26905/g.74163  ORF Transcript_26905/g.74163 Transcript_26905/m.74163 type:complete len:92 (+) Transcript_26905:54-329(+)
MMKPDNPDPITLPRLYSRTSSTETEGCGRSLFGRSCYYYIVAPTGGRKSCRCTPCLEIGVHVVHCVRHMVAMMPEILLYSTLRGLKIIKSL